MHFTTDLKDARQVAALFDEAAEAAIRADCRDGSVDRLPARGTLLATGDIHDNPVHLARILSLAALDASRERHVTFHEVIHGDNLVGGMDFSYRMLARIAELKRRFPEQVHALLGNHELAQIVGSGVLKHGVNCVEAFDEALELTFRDEADLVRAASERFIRSMALALVCENGVFCAHSLPGPHDLAQFDFGVLTRPLAPEDYERGGSAHRLVWGRRLTPEHVRDLAQRLHVALFIIGHMLAETGWEVLSPQALVLNSDHERGCVLPIDLGQPPDLEVLQAALVPLSAIGI